MIVDKCDAGAGRERQLLIRELKQPSQTGNRGTDSGLAAAEKCHIVPVHDQRAQGERFPVKYGCKGRFHGLAGLAVPLCDSGGKLPHGRNCRLVGGVLIHEFLNQLPHVVAVDVNHRDIAVFSFLFRQIFHLQGVPPGWVFAPLDRLSLRFSYRNSDSFVLASPRISR